MRPLLIIIALAVFGGYASAGIDSREAGRLANSYSFCVLHIGCGGVGAPVLRGEHWEVPVFEGIAVNPRVHYPCIHIDRSSGVISYSNHGIVYPTLTRKQLAQRQYD